jgi:3'-phosphoadenosine 5'-phosphosulfate (PAPS) 3'-phosphatase
MSGTRTGAVLRSAKPMSPSMNLLQRLLLGARPGYGWLSEEIEDNELRLACSRVFVIDPIDGTRAYVAGRTGLVREHRPC